MISSFAGGRIYQFLIVALRRMRRAASLAQDVPSVQRKIEDALREFDNALPNLAVMRNVGEHIDAYARDDPKRHHGEVTSGQIQVGTWDGRAYKWLADKEGKQLSLDIVGARMAAEKLYVVIKHVFKNAAKNPRGPSGD